MASEPTRHTSALALEDDSLTRPFHRFDPVDGSEVVTQRWLRSRARAKLGHVTAAVEEIKYLLHAEGLDPALRPVLYHHIGTCYEGADDYHEAEYYYRRALGCDPRFEPALARLHALQSIVSKRLRR